MMKLRLPRGEITLPAFFPDATYGTVRATDAQSVLATKTPGLVMNAFHLTHRPGPKTVKAVGGLHEFAGWPGAILTDSGGFQIFSMIRENPAYGEIRPGGLIYRPDGGKEKVTFTPEKCIQSQLMFGSDILMALDLCTRPDDPDDVQRHSVETTVRWAKICRDTFDSLTARMPEDQRPLLFGIVQGGQDAQLRMECGQRLEEIGFDGYGFGGWPLDTDGSIRLDVLKMAADAMPDHKPKYAMGLGRPEEIVACVQMGYTLFDCVIPTREARHQRLYTFREGVTPDSLDTKGDFYKFMYIMDDHYRRDPRPVDEGCDCMLCQNHSRAFLHHLFKVGESLASQLATIHNLRFYSRLMEMLQQRGEGNEGTI